MDHHGAGGTGYRKQGTEWEDVLAKKGIGGRTVADPSRDDFPIEREYEEREREKIN